ncbi:YbhB/YbcL family Raf kinase inhibitor-like protein [Actinacidiphila acididurans]|uniref:YbhB/YbcL family Raf kinase inhibitor-like protein n=1 Tax=Actinacidiphila acididurans TaxID=2784346 RepID=A0ABS2TSC5_9ACTN|nr:YbhB/YbcL family Raf kinase inhibitor-like protein [Actinacidiphila acididurans]MBM9506237.1 YbhB/YbcL family Raf kinase inhibitor-like protein [Actinacidiphila acididurans]
MTLLGTLLRNSRPDEGNYAWNQPNLSAPETLRITSGDFTDSHPLPPRHAGSRVGGENLSPHLSWSEPPAGTAELLLLIEDIDSPLGSKPAVHCLAIIDEAGLRSPHELPPGALSKRHPAPGVTLLRSTIGRGYHGPEPLKGHGPHRYVVQLYALGRTLLNRPDRDALLKTRPRPLLAAIEAPVLARGRISGIHER